METHITVQVERTCLILLSQFATTFPLGFSALSAPLLDLLLPLLSVKGLEIPVLVYLKALGMCYSPPSSCNSDPPRGKGGSGGVGRKTDETPPELPPKDLSSLFRELSKLLNESNYPHLVVSLATRTLLLWFLALKKDEKERYFKVIVGSITSNMALNTSLVAQVPFFSILFVSPSHSFFFLRWLLTLPIQLYRGVQLLECSLQNVKMPYFS